MQTQTQEHHSEISLYDLWRMIARRKKLIIGLFLISMTAAAIVSLFLPKVYRGEVVLKIPAFETASSNITAKELTDIVGKIDNEKMVNILPKTYSAVTDVKLDAVKESKDKLQVTIEAHKIDVMQPAVLELVEYMNSIDLVKATVKDEQEKLVKRSSELAFVIAHSSELVKTYDHLLKAGRLIPVGFNPVELNKRISEIKLEKLTADQALQRLKGGVDVVKQLYITRRPVKPRTMMNVALSGIMSLFCGILLSFFLEYIEKAKKAINQA